jgi:hypothetical protein
VALAAYTPGAVDFAVGQAAFTVLVVVLFGLLDLPGFDTAVVRVETVTVGVTAAVVLSLVMWPRGARAALAANVADVYREAAEATTVLVTGSPSQRAIAEQHLVAADRRADAAFAVALSEHTDPIDAGSWVAVFGPPRLTRDLLIGLVPGVGAPIAECRAAADAADAAARSAGAQLLVASRAVVNAGDDARNQSGGPDLATSRLALERCLRASNGGGDGLVLVAWIVLINRLCTSIDEARPSFAALAAAGSPTAWFR